MHCSGHSPAVQRGVGPSAAGLRPPASCFQTALLSLTKSPETAPCTPPPPAACIGLGVPGAAPHTRTGFLWVSRAGHCSRNKGWKCHLSLPLLGPVCFSVGCSITRSPRQQLAFHGVLTCDPSHALSGLTCPHSYLRPTQVMSEPADCPWPPRAPVSLPYLLCLPLVISTLGEAHTCPHAPSGPD